MRVFFIVVACLLASAAAQGPGALDSYGEIRQALRRGDEIQLNADSAQCESNLSNGTVLVSMPLRHWEIITLADEVEYIEADDFYVDTPADGTTVLFTIRNLRINDDETVEVNLIFSAEFDPITLNCVIGEGAVAHTVVPGNDLEELNEYNEAKSWLLAGDHVEAVVELGRCSNAADNLPEGVANVQLGFQARTYTIVNDGTPDEMLVIDDSGLFALQDGTETVAAERLILFPDDTAVVQTVLLDLNGDAVISDLTFNCEISDAVFFTIDERENENTMVTYQEIRESALSGHDLESIVFFDLCELVEGEPLPATGVIWGQRFDNFELAPPREDGLETIGFAGYLVTVDGLIEPFGIKVSEDNVATVEYFSVQAGSDAESNNHLWSCPLESSVIFHAVPRSRAPVSNFEELISGVVQRGQTYEIEIDFQECEINNSPLDVILGGIIWESYINPDPVDGYFFGSISSIIQSNDGGSPSPVWEVADILILPDNSVSVTPRLFDFATGEDLFPDAPKDPIVCQLSTNGPGGDRGAFLYRYPF